MLLVYGVAKIIETPISIPTQLNIQHNKLNLTNWLYTFIEICIMPGICICITHDYLQELWTDFDVYDVYYNICRNLENIYYVWTGTWWNAFDQHDEVKV